MMMATLPTKEQRQQLIGAIPIAQREPIDALLQAAPRKVLSMRDEDDSMPLSFAVSYSIADCDRDLNR